MADNLENVEFPYSKDADRLKGYDIYKKLFNGEHFEAFSIKVNNHIYGQEYAKLRYVVANYAGLISKICGDMLFSEVPTVRVENEENQKFIDAFMFENKLHMQNYESAVQNSYYGDSVYKFRIGPRNSYEAKSNKSSLILEDNTPTVYFPKYPSNNNRAEPEYQELAFKIKIGDKDYLRREIHYIGQIINELWLMENNTVKSQVSLNLLGEKPPAEEEGTKIDRSMVYHIPNWKVGERWSGISDYFDLSTVFYAINNRFTKIDNILDTHSDPILAIPDGVLDENGQVKREKFKLFEMPPSVGGEKPQKPEYIVWDASLENAFKEIEHLTEVLFMISETSPDLLGMGQGKADSGRALKLKLLRTIAKVRRKRIYYDQALKEIIFTAQLLAQAHGLTCMGVKPTGTPEVPEILWQDGLPVDMGEAIEQEVARKDAGLTTTKDSLMRLDGLDEKAAEKKAEEIDDETKIELPAMNMNKPFGGSNE